MAKIPTYESKRTPSGKVARPNLPDYSIDIAQTLVRASNKILDAKAIDEGFKQGKVEQAKAFEEGVGYVEQKGYTLRSEAFNKGANAAYVAGMKNKAEQELTALATELNDPLSKVPIDERVSTYTEKANEIRGDYVTSIPSHLQGDLGGYFDALNTRYEGQVFNNQRNMQVDEIKATITGRVDTALENLPALIRDGGYLNNPALEEQFADLVAAIDEGLATISPSTAFAYKEKIKTAIQYSALERAYNGAEDKQAFIEDLEKGGDIYKNVMEEVNSTYFDGDEDRELTQNGESGYRTLAKRLQIQFNNDKADMSVDRALWEQDATTALALFKSGVNPDYVYDEVKMKELGFSDTTVLKYKVQFEIAEAIYPDLIESRGTPPNDNATNLKALKTEFRTLSNKEGLTADDRETLIILQAKIDGVGTILNEQRDAIISGDANLILDQANISYDTSSVEGIQAYHNKLITKFGLSPDNMKLVPQSQLDSDSEIMSTGSWNDIMGLKQKYGKYFERFIADAGLVKDGYQSVALFTSINPAYGEQLYNAINDLEKNIKTAKNIDSEFAGADGSLSEFELAFEEEFKEYLIGNVDLADDVQNAARAIFVQTYLRTGDTEKAKNSIIKNFNKSFQKFEYNGMKVLLPANIDANTIQKNIDDFIKHPQKYGIHTNSLFDINDFKDDIEDNTFENFSLAYDGGQIKIVNNENAMGVVTVFKRLPSADGEISYTNNLNLLENEDNVEHLETKDEVPIWEYEAVIKDVETQDGATVETQDGATVETKEDKTVTTKNFSDSVDEKLAENIIKDEEKKEQEIKEYDEQVKTAATSLTERLDVDGDGMVSAEEFMNVAQAESTDGSVISLKQKQIETLLFEYAKLEDAPIDYYVGTISSDASKQPLLQAISMYVKDGGITESVIELLVDLDAFEGLENDAIASEVLLNWKDNMDRSTKTKPPTRMTPLQALYDYVRDLEEEHKTLKDAEIDEMMKDFIPG